MQSLNSLYFPETVLPHHLRNTPLLLPDSLHLLQPVEGNDSTSADLFMEKEFCQAYTPSPLGKDRERFLGLIQEIQEQKSTNAEQFSGLTLAKLSEERQNGEQSHRTIMANLTGEAFVESEEEAEKIIGKKLKENKLVLLIQNVKVTKER